MKSKCTVWIDLFYNLRNCARGYPKKLRQRKKIKTTQKTFLRQRRKSLYLKTEK